MTPIRAASRALAGGHRAQLARREPDREQGVDPLAAGNAWAQVPTRSPSSVRRVSGSRVLRASGAGVDLALDTTRGAPRALVSCNCSRLHRPRRVRRARSPTIRARRRVGFEPFVGGVAWAESAVGNRGTASRIASDPASRAPARCRRRSRADDYAQCFATRDRLRRPSPPRPLAHLGADAPRRFGRFARSDPGADVFGRIAVSLCII